MKPYAPWFVGGMALMLFMAGCASLPVGVAQPTSTPTPLTRVNACFTGATGPNLMIWYALDKGLFKKYGLDVKLVDTTGPKAVSAMLSGQIDICQQTGSSIVSAKMAGEEPVIVAGIYNASQYSLLVAPTIKTADDLRGKVVAITGGASSPSGTSMRAALTELGLRPGDDVKVVELDQPQGALASVELGQVVGTVLEPPLTAKAQERGLREMVNLADRNTPYPRMVISTTRRYVKDHRDVVTRFVQAMIEAMAATKKDPQGTKAIMAKWLQMDETQDAATLQGTYDTLVLKNLAQVPRVSPAALQTVIDEAKAQNPTAGNVRPEDVVDSSIVDELEKSGFIASLYR
ncbi:MAG: ABC transporter substrate-binding protein [Anaerolineae bacterium]|nr:ABC transporter substrate-binding protein [Anaerolineae bacterium]